MFSSHILRILSSAQSKRCVQSTCNRAWSFAQLNRSALALEENVVKPIIRRPSQLLVQVQASSINPIDVLMIDQYGSKCFEAAHVLDSCLDSKVTYDRFPLTVGRDFVGVVLSTGSEVKHVKVGDQVWGASSPWQTGTHTDLLLTDTCHVAKAPVSISHEQAAAIPYSALTVWNSFKVAQLNSTNAFQQKVLILGVSGGLGQIAAQILKAWRSNVTGVCSSTAIDRLGNQLNVDRLFAYDTNADQLDNLSNEFDVILDFRSYKSNQTEFAYFNSLRSNFKSCYVTTSSPVLRNLEENGFLFGGLKVAKDLFNLHLTAVQTGRHIRWAFYSPDQVALNEITKLVNTNRLTAPIDRVFDFEQLPEAFDLAANGHSRGRIVIRHQNNFHQHSNSVK